MKEKYTWEEFSKKAEINYEKEKRHNNE